MRLLLLVAAFANRTSADLQTDGWDIVPSILEPDLIEELTAASDALLASASNQHLQQDRFSGSLIPVSKDAAFSKLIAHPAALAAIRQRGLTSRDPKWMSGFVISKPPDSPSLGWHQDAWYWDEEVLAYAPPASQLFAMYYLTDTRVSNGCLRLLPGSHMKPTPMHSALRPAHSAEVRSTSSAKANWTEQPEHASWASIGAIDVPVRAGDMVLGDARVLHGAHPNLSSERRTVITIWYIPEYEEKSEAFRNGVAMLHMHQCSEVYGWPTAALDSIRSLLPDTANPRDGDTTSEQPRRRSWWSWRRLWATLTSRLHRRAGGGAAGAAEDDHDAYNHNLDFMVRQPGWVKGGDPRSEDAWKRVQLASRRETTESSAASTKGEL